jgi:hypothetical protein
MYVFGLPGEEKKALLGQLLRFLVRHGGEE